MVYPPREDSLLLAKSIQIPEGARVLDIGTGTGFQALLAAEKAADVVAVDIDPAAVDYAKKAVSDEGMGNIAVLQSDLFENVTGKFDVVIFNPPYLPEDTKRQDLQERTTWDGGKSGREVIARFAAEVGDYLADNGKAYVVISSLTGIDETLLLFKGSGFTAEVVAREKIDWEELVIIRASP